MSPFAELEVPDDVVDPQAARTSAATEAHAVLMISRFMTDSKFGMNSVQETVARCDLRDKMEFRACFADPVRTHIPWPEPHVRLPGRGGRRSRPLTRGPRRPVSTSKTEVR